MRLGLLSALLAALLLSTGPCGAAELDDKLAKAHFSTGQGYFDAGRYGPAVNQFLEAYKLSHRIDLLYNIALCYEKLDDPGRLTTYLKHYLEARPTAPERVEIEAKLYRLASRVATLVIRTTAAGAEIHLDGEVIGLAPIDPQVIAAGKHRVEARFVDQAPLAEEVDLRGGEVREVALDPRPPAPPPPAKPAARADPPPEKPALAAPSLPPPSVVAPRVPPPAPVPSRRLWLIPAVGVPLLAVAAAVVVAVLFMLPASDFGASARASCSDGSQCTLIEFGGAP
ncbi:MAG: PEGA domain-containing protein [Myxococcales bacterium]|nr:PEGA domain-containing protein [Myxococcales bacterium]